MLASPAPRSAETMPSLKLSPNPCGAPKATARAPILTCFHGTYLDGRCGEARHDKLAQVALAVGVAGAGGQGART